MVAAGRLGRKTGAGWYEYPDGEPYRPDDPAAARGGRRRGRRVAIDGAGELARALRAARPRRRLRRARAGRVRRRRRREPELMIDASVPHAAVRPRPRPAPNGVPTALLCADRSLHAARRAARVRLPPAAAARARPARRAHPAALDPGRDVHRRSRRSSARSACTPSGWATGPGLVLGRIVCQLVNEAAFAIGEGVGRTGRRRRRADARPQPSARARRVGPPDRARPRARDRRRPLGRAARPALPRGAAAAARRRPPDGDLV